MLATGKIHPETPLKKKMKLDQFGETGLEYSGVDDLGKRVMGVTVKRSLANLCTVDDHFCWEIPEHWTLEDGATVPSAYATCYLALYTKGNVYESISIDSI